MNFDLSDEQKAIADTFRSLLRDRLTDSQLLAHLDNGALDLSLWHDIGELGGGGVLVPESAGGLGLDLVTLAVISEALGYHAAPVPVVTNALAAWLIERVGSEKQRQRWLGALTCGEAIAAFAFGEANDRWLPGQWTLGHSQDSYMSIIEGQKSYVEWGDAAHVYIVGLQGGRLALVERGPELGRTSVTGIDATRPLSELDFRRTGFSELNATADDISLLIDAMLVLLAADACGAASAALDRAIAYAKERQQFGQAIGRFQALKHQLADMAVEIEPTRPLYWYAAHVWDVDPKKVTRIAALAKAHVTNSAVLVARAAVEAHGGIGYTWEFPIHIFLKRSVYDRTFLGGPRIHQQRVAQLSGW